MSFSKPALASPRRVAVIGAGVAGLGIAWRLAQRGVSVDVFDKGPAGAGASHAAAGMLAAGVECEPGEEGLWPLNRASQEMWPSFAREVQAASGVDVQYRDEGTLVVAPTRDDGARLEFSYRFQRDLGVRLEWLTPAEARRREPAVRGASGGAVFSPDDHQVENRLLTAGLKRAALGAGARLHENRAVAAVRVDGGVARGLRLADGAVHEADAVVLAAGPWSRLIEGLPEEARPPVRPVKGQMLALGMDRAEPLLRHVLWGPNVYLVPRLDGRLVIGATVEERGFDDSMTAGGVFALLEAARRLVPAIEDLPIVETWVGHRPTSRDDAPILGPAPLDRLVLACGQHRNGILQAPYTADAIARLLIEGDLPAEARPFTLERFRPRRPAAAAAGLEVSG